ncbi:MAG: pyridoxamine 5'-phosphate oxidase family protein [Bacteroidota bacterium]
MEVLNYSQLEKEAISFISVNKKMVLATCSENRVTARTISIINDGLLIYFQTDQDFIKYRQIKANPNVALSIGNMQLEGVATPIGHPLENSFFIDNYRKHHQSAFRLYSHLKDNVIIEVKPRLITFWKYDQDHKPYRDFLNITQQIAYREKYFKADQTN